MLIHDVLPVELPRMLLPSLGKPLPLRWLGEHSGHRTTNRRRVPYLRQSTVDAILNDWYSPEKADTSGCQAKGSSRDARQDHRPRFVAALDSHGCDSVPILPPSDLVLWFTSSVT